MSDGLFNFQNSQFFHLYNWNKEVAIVKKIIDENNQEYWQYNRHI